MPTASYAALAIAAAIADVVRRHYLEECHLTGVRIDFHLDNVRRAGRQVRGLRNPIQLLRAQGALARLRRGGHLGERQTLGRSTVHDARTVVKSDYAGQGHAVFDVLA